MRTADVVAALASMRPEIEDLESEVGQRDHVAFLRIWRVGPSKRWADVNSPGDVWFSLDVDGGFGLNHLEEETPDDEARNILENT